MKEKEPVHICEGRVLNYIRGTRSGDGGVCTNSGKFFQQDEGKWYCGIHSPDKIKEREVAREKKVEAKIKTYGFKIGQRIYEEQGESEREAWIHLLGKMVEVENLGELKS